MNTAESAFNGGLFSQAAKYLVVGGLCTILDFSVLFVLTRYGGLNYVSSSVFSFMVGTALNYYLCILWVFDVRVVGNRHQEFLYYTVITGVGLGINTFMIWGLTEFLGLYFMLSKLSATLVTFIWNFGARKYFLHTNK